MSAPASHSVRGKTLGVLREVKNMWERRCPVSPAHVRKLVGMGVHVKIQPCSKRIYSDGELAAAGAELTEDLSTADLVLGVKEFPAASLPRDKSVLIFSHVIKGQHENMPFLDECLARNVRLFDYELFRNPTTGRRNVAFGRFAGLAGMVDTLSGMGKRLLCKGHATPFLNVSLSYQYPSVSAALDAVGHMGREIQRVGLPPVIGKLSFVFTGSGAVANGAMEVFRATEAHWLQGVHELPGAFESDTSSDLLGVQTSLADLMRRKTPADDDDGTRAHTTTNVYSLPPFDKLDYYEHPHHYEPIFAQRVLPYTSVLVNGAYWDARFPRIITDAQLRKTREALRKRGDSPLQQPALMCVSDISCDIGGSVQFLKRASTLDEPFYVFTDHQTVSSDLNEDGVLMCAVDNLPAEFPLDASEHFSSCLEPILPDLLAYDPKRPFTDQPNVSKPTLAACVTVDGTLAPHMKYIDGLRDQLGAAAPQNKRNGSHSGRRARRNSSGNRGNSVEGVDGEAADVLLAGTEVGLPDVDDTDPGVSGFLMDELATVDDVGDDIDGVDAPTPPASSQQTPMAADEWVPRGQRERELPPVSSIHLSGLLFDSGTMDKILDLVAHKGLFSKILHVRINGANLDQFEGMEMVADVSSIGRQRSSVVLAIQVSHRFIAEAQARKRRDSPHTSVSDLRMAARKAGKKVLSETVKDIRSLCAIDPSSHCTINEVKHFVPEFCLEHPAEEPATKPQRSRHAVAPHEKAAEEVGPDQPSRSWLGFAPTTHTSSAKTALKYRILVLGSGFIAGPVVDYLATANHGQNHLTVASMDVAVAEGLTSRFPNAHALHLDVSEESRLKMLIKYHHAVVSLLPASLHENVAKLCVEFGRHMVNPSYESAGLRALHKEAEEAGVIVLSEVGLDPGIDHMSAMDTLAKIKRKGDQLLSFRSFCGGLPAPEHADHPIGYKFSWDPTGVLKAAQAEASFKLNGKISTVPGTQLGLSARPFCFNRGFQLEQVPNRDSLKYAKLYGIEAADTIYRGTLRYPGFFVIVHTLASLGLLTPEPWQVTHPDVPVAVVWEQVMAHALGVAEADLSGLSRGETLSLLLRQTDAHIASLPFTAEQRVLVGDAVRTLGLCEFQTIRPGSKGVRDALATLLASKLTFGREEVDMVILTHEFVSRHPDRGATVTTQTLTYYGQVSPTNAPAPSPPPPSSPSTTSSSPPAPSSPAASTTQPAEGYSAMAMTVGLPVAIAVQLVLDSRIQRRGTLLPIWRDIYEPIMNELSKAGLVFKEQDFPLDETQLQRHLASFDTPSEPKDGKSD